MAKQTRTIAALPFDFGDLLAHLRISPQTADLESVRINRLAWAAVDHVEQHCQRSFASRTYTRTLPGFSCKIELPHGPITEVEDIEYWDVTNEEEQYTFSRDDFYLVDDVPVPYITPVDEWPDAQDRPDAVTVTYTAGGYMPPSVQHACFLLVGAWNENHEAEITGTITAQLAIGVDRLLAPWKKRQYA